MFRKSLGIALGLALGVCCYLGLQAQSQAKTTSTANAGQAPVQTVSQVDLNRYMGQWYELATIPMFFERRCTGNVTANYKMLPNGQVEVLNSCEVKDGRRITSTGRAKVMDSQTHAKLKVTFLNFFGWRFLAGGDYWIIALDPNYQYAVVGHPTRRYLWILSRTPSLPDATLSAISAQLVKQGYEPCELFTTAQKNGFSSRRPWCEVVK